MNIDTVFNKELYIKEYDDRIRMADQRLLGIPGVQEGNLSGKNIPC
jgi:hypothetical protein